MQRIKKKIDGQSRLVASRLKRARHLVLMGDMFSAAEVSTLENSGGELRARVDRALSRTSKLLGNLSAARIELVKLQ